MTRTFLAIELADDVRAALTREIARLARVLPNVHWVTSADVHLTLAFLGELDDARLAAATNAAREATRDAAPFDLQLAGLGTFGPPAAPRVVWAGVGGEVPELVALQKRLAGALEARDFPRESRPFAPHLTLARLKSPLALPALERLRRLLADPPEASTVSSAPWLVDALAVMKSELGRPAARYTRLARVPLGAANDGNR
jgi:2'-5' RNA ligase